MAKEERVVMRDTAFIPAEMLESFPMAGGRPQVCEQHDLLMDTLRKIDEKMDRHSDVLSELKVNSQVASEHRLRIQEDIRRIESGLGKIEAVRDKASTDAADLSSRIKKIELIAAQGQGIMSAVRWGWVVAAGVGGTLVAVIAKAIK